MIEYIVNKEKRTVIAMIKFGNNEETFKHSSYIYDDINWALTRIKKNESHNETKKFKCNYEKMFFPKTMSAKAKCNPEDEWDEEYGKQLARQRLVEKIKKYRSNSYEIIDDSIAELRKAFSKKIAINELKYGKVFDWNKASKIIKERKLKTAYAGMSEDWFWTGTLIYENGKPVKDNCTYLASSWATPVLRFDGEEIVCYQPRGYHGWNENTRWPKSALKILNSKECLDETD